jgi:ankyrin repeat protein
VRILLARENVDIEYVKEKDKNGRTALDHARIEGHETIVKLLEDY